MPGDFLGADFDDVGPPIGIIIVFGAWMLIALRHISLPGIVLTGAVVAILGLAWYLFSFEPATATATAPHEQTVTVLEQLVLLIALLVIAVVGLALLLPAEGDRYTADRRLLAPLFALMQRYRQSGRDDGGSEASFDPPANSVARAWWSVAERAGVDPRQTPGTVAQAAIDRGYPREDVEELRAVFERVRYGGAAVSDTDRTHIEQLRDRIDRDGTDANEPVGGSDS